MAMPTGYSFIGNGSLLLAECDLVGNPKDFERFGNVTDLSLSFSKNRVDRRNYQKRGNPIDKAANISTDAGLSFTVNDIDRRILKLYFGGSEFTTPAGAITGELLPLNLTDAKWATPEDALLTLAQVNIDLTVAPVLRYGTSGSITNVVPAENYTLSKSGDLSIKSSYLAGLTAAQATHWNIDYSHLGNSGFAAGSRLSGCTKKFWLKLSGNNLSECGDGEHQVVDFYKCVLTPEGGMDLISEDFSELPFTGMLLLDDTRPVGGANGEEWEEYFRIRRF